MKKYTSHKISLLSSLNRATKLAALFVSIALTFYISVFPSTTYALRPVNPPKVENPEPVKTTPLPVISRQTNFNLFVYGLHFNNDFVNKIVPFDGYGNFETRGRCGGMAYTSLDYYYAHRPSPNIRSLPPDSNPLAQYIFMRLIDSFLKPSAAKYITLSGASDHETVFGGKGLTRWTKEDEFPKLRSLVDSGSPLVLGLIAANNMLNSGDNHQVVAYGYTFNPNDNHIEVKIYDNNYHDTEAILVTDPNNPHVNEYIIDPSTKQLLFRQIWRGFFVHEYSPKIPPSL